MIGFLSDFLSASDNSKSPCVWISYQMMIWIVLFKTPCSPKKIQEKTEEDPKAQVIKKW